MLGALHYLHRHVGRVLEVLRQPDSGEVPPAELLDEHVAVHEDFADMAGMVAEWRMGYPSIT